MSQNDPNIGRRVSQPVTKKDNNRGWIIGGAVAIAVILGLLLLYERSGTPTNTKPVNTTTGAVTTVPGPPASIPAR